MNQRAKCCLFGREQRDLTFPGTWEADKKPSVITNYAIAHITTPKHATPRGHQLCTALLRRPHTFSHGRGRVAPPVSLAAEKRRERSFSPVAVWWRSKRGRVREGARSGRRVPRDRGSGKKCPMGANVNTNTGEGCPGALF